MVVTTDVGVRVTRVRVRGNKRTREHIIRQELAPALQCRSYDELGDALVDATQRLHDLGIFRRVDVLLDADEAVGLDEAGFIGAALVVSVVEGPRVSATTGTYVQNGEGSAEMSISAKNVLGLAERADLHVTRGHERSNAYRVSLAKPRPLGTACTLQLGARKQLASRERLASHCEKEQAADVSIAWGEARAPGGAQELGLELGLREVCKLTPAASPAVRAAARTSARAAVRHSLALDRRQGHPLAPESGWAARLTTEVGGLGGVGDGRSLKAHAEAALHLPLWERLGLVASLSAGLGALAPLGGGGGGGGGAEPGRAPASFLTDRFLLGGVATVRGFRTNAIGPRDVRRALSAEEMAALVREQRVTAEARAARFDMGLGGGGGGGGGADGWGGFGGVGSAGGGGAAERAPLPRGTLDSLGGDVMAHGLAALSCALPGVLGEHGVRAQLFANGGNLLGWGELVGSGASAHERARAFAAGMRLSVGAGLVMPTPLGRLELNACHVLRRFGHDSTKRFQLGLCAQFL